MISIIVAMAKNGVIGHNNTLPWRLPADLKYFRDITMGHTIVMGRRNYEDIGKALPGRRNIVITRNKDFLASGCEITHSIGEALDTVKGEAETFIIGGAEIYKSFLPLAGKLYVTRIDAEVEGNTTFPEYDSGQWLLESEEKHETDKNNSLPFRFCVYHRVY